MSSVVAVIGKGVLADLICAELNSAFWVIRTGELEEEEFRSADLVILAQDGWLPAVQDRAEEVLQAAKVPWLRGFVSFGEALIGPLVRPGVQGCSRCADMRRLMATVDRKELRVLQQQLAERGGIPQDAWASRTGLTQVATLLATEARRVLLGGQPQLEGRILLVNLKTLKTSRHLFLHDPMCPVCGELPEDSEELANFSLRSSPKIHPNSFRCRSIDELKQVLTRDYLDFRTGLINGKMKEGLSPFADITVNLPFFAGDEPSSGRTLSYADSELTAILEGLERHCGVVPRGKWTKICKSYREIADHALNPLEVGVHAEEQYARPDFPFRRFDPDCEMDWVWGRSIIHNRPILVPELLAYYSLGCGNGVVYETSNGCALGGSMEEAIFHGIMEVLERDSFLLTWYAQLPLSRVDPYSAGDRELNMMIDRMRAVAGYELHVFDATMEHGIPCIWTYAKNLKSRGMNLICAAGAHLDPIRALKSAIFELAGMMLSLDDRFEANRQESERMAEDPFQVREMEHHSMLYGLPETEKRLDFLWKKPGPPLTFREAFPPQSLHTDLADDLKMILEKFRSLNLDVIVVDQTSPELKRNGLTCVKVLIPGMLPMTFGHHLTRVTGLERVLKVPAQLGYTKQPLTVEQLNPHPHPFP
ncbi:TOMM precursor leader peptide-binding protein [Paenibacillus sp. MZ04-78.2]|uniref:TOMM precursor leader peptide-binding protein n=1 Tax=Paenibacillus sp. MZ04-78.2 TaxID=2962034 RepID=UPI0020B734CD|nr:TOMM precursor leader peptide-binding protein [Paenibacillus sp. MZ04-78.2]MCP3772953.1 TOMM precursor leader peptide-binding protein [Paenibacillus sp. MZ04-78.2]